MPANQATKGEADHDGQEGREEGGIVGVELRRSKQENRHSDGGADGEPLNAGRAPVGHREPCNDQDHEPNHHCNCQSPSSDRSRTHQVGESSGQTDAARRRDPAEL